MHQPKDIFAGDDPVNVAARWLEEAAKLEPGDPNAMQLATVDAGGMPDVRTVLLKEIEGPSGAVPGASQAPGASPAQGAPRAPGAFLFYTNYEGAKSVQLAETGGRCAFVLHWKSLRRQVRVRGIAAREDGARADAYYASRGIDARLGAWASAQSRPLASRAALMAEVAKAAARHGTAPARPPHWGGWRIVPSQMELWADGAARLHDRFHYDWDGAAWTRQRLNP